MIGKTLDKVNIKDIQIGMKIKEIKTNRKGLITNKIRPCDSFCGGWEIGIVFEYEPEKPKKIKSIGFFYDEKNKLKNFILIK